MRTYHDNPRWLIGFAPFRALSVSAAYLVPFFLEKGLSQSEIFLLQSIFSLAYVLLEVPSGWLADRVGRALVIKLSVPIAASAMVLYGLSSYFWQFVVLELLLAVANVLISGADKALLIDSLQADGRIEQYSRISQKIAAMNFAGVVIGVPLAVLLVKYIGIEATLVADGILTVMGGTYAFRLREPPAHAHAEPEAKSLWKALRQLYGKPEGRWLVSTAVLLSTGTYFGFWLSAPYYISIGIPVSLFAVILAARSAFKALLCHLFDSEMQPVRIYAVYIGFVSAPYLLVATGYPWLALSLLGHDVVQALAGPPLERRYNAFVSTQYRATLNSMVGLQARLVLAALGPVIGFAVDAFGLYATLMYMSFMFGGLGCIAYVRLVQLKAFR